MPCSRGFDSSSRPPLATKGKLPPCTYLFLHPQPTNVRVPLTSSATTVKPCAWASRTRCSRRGPLSVTPRGLWCTGMVYSRRTRCCPDRSSCSRWAVSRPARVRVAG